MLTFISRQTIPLKSKRRSTRTHMLTGARESTCHVICAQPLHLCNLSRQVINDLTTHPQLVLRARSPQSPSSLLPLRPPSPPSGSSLPAIKCACALLKHLSTLQSRRLQSHSEAINGLPGVSDQLNEHVQLPFTGLVNRPPFHNGGLFLNQHRQQQPACCRPFWWSGKLYFKVGQLSEKCYIYLSEFISQ